MKIAACAGAIALATSLLLSNIGAASASESASIALEPSALPASVDIGRIHSVLKLTSDQEHYWPPIESALRDIARHQQAGAESDGIMRRLSRRVVSIVLNSVAVERLARAARPLIAKLDDDQKRAAGGLAQEMGLGPVVMAALR